MGDGEGGLPLGAARIQGFQRAITRLPPGPLKPADILTPEFELWSEWDIDCHYAPLDGVEPTARIVLVAINPGLPQALAAFTAARDRLWAQDTWEQAVAAAQRAAVYSGPQATNLARMFDALRLPERLRRIGVEVTSARALLADPAGVLHLTHCVRYPVRVQHREYTGRRPVLLRNPRLLEFVSELLAPELEAAPAAIVVPLGRIAGEALAFLAARRRLDLERCLFGIPHPSGANGHREDDFIQARPVVEARLDAWFGRLPALKPEPRTLNTIG